MKKIKLFYVSLLLIFSSAVKAQVFCIQCFHQNEPVAPNANNLILNGSFESSNCMLGQGNSFCTNSLDWNCNLDNWTSYGGGTATYAHMMDSSESVIPDGTRAVYFGNMYAKTCSSLDHDTSCFVSHGDCQVIGIPFMYPTNETLYGGSSGVSIHQTVSGLTIGRKYVLEFWAGGEIGFNGFFTAKGLFAADIGLGNIFLRDEVTGVGDTGTVFLIGFEAFATSQVIKFTNWGHCCQYCTELILDNVKLYEYAELPPFIPDCTAGINDVEDNFVTDVFPNPFTNEIKVETKSKVELNFVLYDLSSREIMIKNFKGDQSFDMRNISEGIYLYKVIRDGRIVSAGKLIKLAE